MVERLHAGWRRSIVDALQVERDAGLLRVDVDLEVVAGIVLSTVWGFASDFLVSKEDLMAAAGQLRAWMTVSVDQPSPTG